jgi:hypothetical protein
MNSAEVDMADGPFRLVWMIEQNSAVEGGYLYGEFVEIRIGTSVHNNTPFFC